MCYIIILFEILIGYFHGNKKRREIFFGRYRKEHFYIQGELVYISQMLCSLNGF